MAVAFLHGLILSFGLILPIGVQNGFILTQGATHARWYGSLPAVVTASLCDTLLIALAVFGVSSIALHIGWIRYVFGGIGILFLGYMGVSAWRTAAVRQQNVNSAPWRPKVQISFAASVSLLNPHALLDTLAVIGGSAATYTVWADRLSFGAACVIVSWLWFIGLSLAGHMMGKATISVGSRGLLNRVAAVMMWASAIYLGYIVYSFH